METPVVPSSTPPTPDLPPKSGEETLPKAVFAVEVDAHSRQTVTMTPEALLLNDIQKASKDSVSKKISFVSENKTMADSSKETVDICNEKTVLKMDGFFESEQGRYQILELLGEGGMGIVQNVRDHLLERDIAVKRIRIQTQNRSTTREQKVKTIRLQREAMLMAFLEHPNIVPIYEMQKSPNGELQFTMRKVQGSTLKSFFRDARLKSERCSEEFFLSIFLKVCDAVSYAHSRSVVHRDLKPDNIMVGAFGEVYVMDWGIAKRLNVSENSDLISFLESSPFANLKTIGGLGTPGYMAPEQQANAGNVSLQADIYSLGKILRECYTYYSPIEEIKLQVDYANKLLRQGTLPRENLFLPEVPKDIQAIVEKSTTPVPTERYPSVKALVDDLNRYRQYARVSARDYSLLEGLRLWKQRHRKSLISGALFLVAFLGLFFYFRYEKKQESSSKFRTTLNEAKLKEAETESLDPARISLKIKSLSQVLASLNIALSIVPGHPEAEQFKSKVGQNLIDLACNTENYQMAEYLQSELQLLSCLSPLEKMAISEKIEEHRTRQLKRNQKRFLYWETRFRNHQQEEGDWETALFEISKMKEKEILQSLEAILKESVDYYEQTETRTITKNEFYLLMITVLGRSESPEIGKIIRLEVIKFANHLLKIPLAKRPTDKIQFLIVLIEALGNLQETKALPALIDIAFMLGNGDLLEKKIEAVIQKLVVLEQEGLRWNEPPDVLCHYRALFQYYQKEYKNALETIQKAIQLNPSHADYYNTSALIKETLEQWAEAQSDLNIAIQLNPQLVEAYINRGRGKLRLKAYEESIQDFEKAMALNPQKLKVYILLKQALCEQKKYVQAIQVLKSGIEAIPQGSQLFYELALIYTGQKEWPSALEAVSIAIYQDPYFSDAYGLRGEIYTESGDIPKAIEDYSQMIQLNPKEEKAYLNRSLLHLALQDVESAFQDATHVLEMNPKSALAYTVLGFYYLAQENTEEAIVQFTTSIELEPTYLAYYNRALCQMETHPQKALVDFSGAIELAPENSDAYYFRGKLKEQFGYLEEALNDYSQGIQRNPNDMDLYKKRGALYIVLERYPEALVDMNTILQYRPKELSAYKQRVYIKIQLNDILSALEDQNRILQQEDKASENYYNRASLYARLQQFESALTDVFQAIKLAPDDPSNSELLIQIVSDYLIQQYQLKQFEKAFELGELFKKQVPLEDSRYESLKALFLELEAWKKTQEPSIKKE